MRMTTSMLSFLAMAAVACASHAEDGLRNPFWPRGYEGERSPISAEVRRKKPKPKPAAAEPKPDPKAAAKAAEKAAAAKAAAEKAAKEAAEKAAREQAAREAAAKAEAERTREINSDDWKKAMKSLKIGNPAVFKSEDGTVRSTISINGNIYADGDLMSVTQNGIRFTWRVRGLDGKSKLRLDRIKARRVK